MCVCVCLWARERVRETNKCGSWKTYERKTRTGHLWKECVFFSFLTAVKVFSGVLLALVVLLSEGPVEGWAVVCYSPSVSPMRWNSPAVSLREVSHCDGPVDHTHSSGRSSLSRLSLEGLTVFLIFVPFYKICGFDSSCLPLKIEIGDCVCQVALIPPEHQGCCS